MRNDFKEIGGAIAVSLRRNDGTTLVTIIDNQDLSIAQSIAGRWYGMWNSHTKSFYATGSTDFRGTECTKVRLHRLILNAPNGIEVDHINHDTLDNRRCNLRLSLNNENHLNRRPVKPKWGAYGITPLFGKWRVLAPNRDGCVCYLGLYPTREKAVAARIDAEMTWLL